MQKNIALSGRSGCGKSTIARYLATKHGYSVCHSGGICRDVCKRLFQSDSKEVLNSVTDAMKSIDNNVWLKCAVREAPKANATVFDSMRFATDFEFLRNQGYITIQVRASLNTCIRRLEQRGQSFNPGVDDLHPAEVELLGVIHDHVIDSENDDIDLAYKKLEEILSSYQD